MEHTHGWKVGSQINIDAEKAWEEMERIGEEKTPRMVLDFATGHKRSELYKHFDMKGLWDDKTAADICRLNEARHLLQSITIVRNETDDSGEVRTITIFRALENVENENDSIDAKTVYVPTEKALQNPEQRDFILDNIMKGLNEYEEKGRLYNAYLKNPDRFFEGLTTALKSIR